MWELTLALNQDEINILDFIYSKLASQVKFAGGIIIRLSIDGRAKISIAVPAKQKEYFVLLLLEIVSEAIAVIYKNEFLTSHVGFLGGTELNKCALMGALTIFDKETDKDLVKKNLIFDRELNIDRFYNFKLQDLRQRWIDICALLKENNINLQTSGGTMELIKFLLKTSETNAIVVHIFENDKHFELTDGKKPINYLSSETNLTDSFALKELIAISPAKIVLHNARNNIPLYDKIIELYDEKVEINYAN